MTKIVFNPLSNSFDYVSSSDDFINDFFPSTLGAQVWASAQIAQYDALGGGITQEQADGWYHPSGFVISGDQYSRAYISASTGVFAPTTHSHDDTYYSETEIDNNFYTKTWIDSLSGSIDDRIDAIEADTFDHESYVYSSTAIGRFADSSNYSSHKSDSTIHFTVDSALENLLDDFYPSSLGKQVSSQVALAYASAQIAIYDAGVGDITHEQAEGWYYPSSLGRGVSSQLELHIADTSLHSSSQSWSGSTEFYAVSTTAFKSGVAEVNMLSDVDTQTTAPTRDYVLKWNGNNWVPALYNATFVFSILTFTDNEATTQLIGTGVWQADETMTFGTTYENGPPDEAWIQVSINGGAYSKVGTMTGPAYTAGTNDLGDINYPAARGQYLLFRISANCGSDTDSKLETSIYFHNYIRYGVTTETSGWDTDDINALGGSVTATYATSYSINAGASEYLIFAHPATYTSLHVSGMKFNSVICPFEEPATVSVTNTAGYTENYKVYRSTLANLGNSTLVTSTSNTKINNIYYGITSTASSYSEGDIEGLGTSVVSNTKGRTFVEAPTVGEYILYCLPLRLGTVTFTVGGFEGGFESPETVSVTNVNGQTEDYYVYRSTNSGLGSSTVVVT